MKTCNKCVLLNHDKCILKHAVEQQHIRTQLGEKIFIVPKEYCNKFTSYKKAIKCIMIKNQKYEQLELSLEDECKISQN